MKYLLKTFTVCALVVVCAALAGCTVSLVEAGAVDNYTREIGKIYHAKTGLEATFYIAGIGSGAHKLY